MKTTLKLLGLLTVKFFQHSGEKLATFLHIPFQHSIVDRHTVPWAYGKDIWFPTRETIYYHAPGEAWVSCIYIHRVEVWGDWVLTVDFAPDGGGEITVFHKHNQMVGTFAEELQARYKKEFDKDLEIT